MNRDRPSCFTNSEFVLAGEYEYYRDLKRICPPQEWETVEHRILEQLKSSSSRSWKAQTLYTHILVEEKKTARLLEYVRSNKSEITEYYPLLIGEFADEVYSLFVDWIKISAAHASNRKQYKKLCGTIKHLAKAGGITPAKQIVEQLLRDYPSRSALREELNNFNLA
ncbi:hypothetical protein [Paenibacillus sp. ATY16]|uniref:hypothetical protein n=1 Tax=Paenibacillus sp. ATY16 TaxID=1759312 RepID=UPI00200C1A8A|nr:hypothetical protein [Paenibacillus sp. ATY16]